MASQEAQRRVSVGTLRVLAAEVFEVAPHEVVDGASFYEELGIDSLQKVEFVVRLERHLGVKFTDAQASGLRNFGDAIAVLNANGIVLEP